MVEFPQTPANLTAIGSNLFELIRARAIVAYPDDGISAALSHAIVKESVRGLQITKEKSSHKIDVVVALAMAAYAATTRPVVVEQVPTVVPPDLSVHGHAYGAQNLRGVPQHYLADHRNEPWRRFVNADGSVSPCAAAGGKYWGRSANMGLGGASGEAERISR